MIRRPSEIWLDEPHKDTGIGSFRHIPVSWWEHLIVKLFGYRQVILSKDSAECIKRR